MTLWCESCLFDDYDGAEEPCINCVVRKDEKPTEFIPKRPTKPQTNADRIRSMTDNELAEWVWSAESSGRAYGPRGKNAWLNWLKAPVEEVDNVCSD